MHNYQNHTVYSTVVLWSNCKRLRLPLIPTSPLASWPDCHPLFCLFFLAFVPTILAWCLSVARTLGHFWTICDIIKCTVLQQLLPPLPASKGKGSGGQLLHQRTAVATNLSIPWPPHMTRKAQSNASGLPPKPSVFETGAAPVVAFGTIAS